jgi:hypothetical protein
MEISTTSTIDWARNCSLSSKILAAGLPDLAQATLELVIGYMNSKLPDTTVCPNKAQLRFRGTCLCFPISLISSILSYL